MFDEPGDGEWGSIPDDLEERIEARRDAEGEAKIAQNGQSLHTLPNGCSLYWEENGAGGRSYYSDEIGGGVLVWDTSLVDRGTLLAALLQEEILIAKERRQRNISHT